ncbi:hypothetical protein G4G27_14370 [Sphingomonas sp. So64.6b]|uniref:hypothetical protein n=1 Tax=Sphingomonas sp. So64.6b TaxID=2997354 RepID=UPI0016018DFA|nr:hypothetical protein [Sphingomonas sp. So64.6b]QNA85048.1 hypothetical protein G4G27_14370 [Sphingomonas sp. So64.6b]
MTEMEATTNRSGGSIETAQRKPWSSPKVIVSTLRDSEANVTRFTDGSTPFFGPYGS